MSKDRIKNTALLFVTLLVMTIMAEAFLRAKFPFDPNLYYPFRPNLDITMNIASGVMAGISGPSKFQTNKLGIRGDDISPSDSRRILTMGGSATECLYLDQAEAWPQLLQTNLRKINGESNVWVGNIGKSGFAVKDILVLLEHLPVSKYRIDTLIIMTGVNDLLGRLTRGVPFEPEGETTIAMRNYRLKRAYQLITPNESKLYAYSAIYRLVHDFYNIYLADTAHAQLPERIIQNDSGRWYEQARRQRFNAPKVASDEVTSNHVTINLLTSDHVSSIDSLQAATNDYRADLEKLIKLADKKGTEIRLVTHPYMYDERIIKWKEWYYWLGGIGNRQSPDYGMYLSTELMARGMRAFNKALMDTCKEHDLLCFDLAANVVGDIDVFYDGVHFNENGARQVAGLIANFLSH